MTTIIYICGHGTGSARCGVDVANNSTGKLVYSDNYGSRGKGAIGHRSTGHVIERPVTVER